ncbi:MAG: hypothetical protein JOZ72_08615 [Alphaproteobacteria bacterium]|nr:hypothetical protein [Alphaproteobacteria bacterium]
MSARIVFLAAAAALLCAGPALAQNYGMYGAGAAQEQSFGPTPHDSTPSDEKGPVSRDSMAIAEDMRLKGECDKAVPILRRLSERGEGFEISQLDLGLCLFDLAKLESDAAKAGAVRSEAASWVVRAANAGFAKAQARAVSVYLDATGVPADPVEAQKWALLYHDNGMRLGFGLPDIAPDLRKRLDAALDDAGRAAARKRARDWSPTVASADE